MGLPFAGAVVGGGSDGNLTSALAVPTLDGLGAVGAGPHARHEHVRIGPTLERLALLTALLRGPA
jgi:glutamate carboxypeptidase